MVELAGAELTAVWEFLVLSSNKHNLQAKDNTKGKKKKKGMGRELIGKKNPIFHTALYASLL